MHYSLHLFCSHNIAHNISFLCSPIHWLLWEYFLQSIDVVSSASYILQFPDLSKRTPTFCLLAEKGASLKVCNETGEISQLLVAFSC